MPRFCCSVRITIVAAAILLCGCAPRKKSEPTPVSSTWESPAAPRPPESGPPEPMVAASRPAGAADPNGVVAVVNGSRIRWGDMVPMLVESHGLSLLEDLILLTAVRQRAQEMSLSVSRADIQAAHEEALRRLATPIVSDESQQLDREAAEKLLSEFLTAKNLSQSDWDRRMEQRAYLRAIARAEVAKVAIKEDDIRNEYGVAYGERVQVRHVQLSSLAAVDRAHALLKDRKDFELVARQLSENNVTAVNGGLLPPFTRNDPAVTPLFREASFKLAEGEISAPVREGNWFHLIRLERRFPASSVGYDNVDHQKLRARLLDRLTRQYEEQLEAQLFRSAAVYIEDPVLDRQFRRKHREPER